MPVCADVPAQRGKALGHMIAISARMEQKRRILNPKYTRQLL
jgi:hypothetical protein